MTPLKLGNKVCQLPSVICYHKLFVYIIITKKRKVVQRSVVLVCVQGVVSKEG